MVAAGAVAVRFAPDGQAVATFWPAAGLGLILLSLNPRRRWLALAPLLALATCAGDLLADRGLRLAVAHGVVETIALVIAALLVTHGGRIRPRLVDQEDFVRLFGAAVVSGGMLVLGGASAYRIVTLEPFGLSLATSFAAHVAAVLLLLPLAVVTENHWTGRKLELMVQVVLLCAASVFTFVPGASSMLTFAPVLFLAWAALRFDLRVACAELVLLGIFVSAQTAGGLGPFGDAVDNDRVSSLTGGALTQGYLACAALLVLPLGIAVQRNTILLDRITADGKLFRRNFTESLVGMAFLEPDDTGRDLVIVDLNETALGILGGREEELMGLRVSDVMDVGPDYLEALPQLIAGSIDGWRVEGPLSFARSGQVTLQISSLGESGDEPFFAAQLLDVTAEYDARHGLEAAQTLTNATLDTTNCIIMVTNLEGIVVRVNQATSVITGYREDELLGRKVWETGITPSDADDVEALIMWPNRSGVPIVRESDSITKTGEKLRIVWNTNIVRDEQLNPMYAVMTGIDVTAERTTAGLVNHLMEASLTTAIVGIDTAGRVSVANSGIQHLLGYERDELVGEPFHRLLKSSELLERTGADTLDEAFDILVRGLGRDGETRARDWTWLTKSGARAAGLDDTVGRPGRLRRTERLPVRGPRRDRAAEQPGDADRRPRQGADRGRAAPLPRPGQERVRLHGLPRAPDAGHQHRRLHRDDAGRDDRGAAARPAAAAGDHQPQRSAADLDDQRPAHALRPRLGDRPLAPRPGRPGRHHRPDRGSHPAAAQRPTPQVRGRPPEPGRARARRPRPARAGR